MAPKIATFPTEIEAAREQSRQRAIEPCDAVPPNVLRYKSGQEIRKGDRVRLHGNVAEIEAVFCDARRMWRGAVVVWDLVASARTVIPRTELDDYQGLRFVSRSSHEHY